VRQTPSTGPSRNSTVGGEDQIKPRSLRFTWSMKTTSSRDPNEIMAEIRKEGAQAPSSPSQHFHDRVRRSFRKKPRDAGGK